MFVKQLHDFDFRRHLNARLARVNVELEQNAHTIGSIIANRFVQRSLAFVVDRVLIDAVQRTQQLAHAYFAVHTCVMQRRPTFFCEYVMRQQTLLKNTRQKTDPRSFRSFSAAPQAISISTISVRPRKTASCTGCKLIKRHEARLRRTDISTLFIYKQMLTRIEAQGKFWRHSKKYNKDIVNYFKLKYNTNEEKPSNRHITSHFSKPVNNFRV